jgi:ABC-2 type transport system permease protein
LSLLILVASLAVFAAFGIFYAAFVVVFKRGDMIMSLFTAIMGLGGGVFFPTSVLPSGLRPLAQAFPLTQASNLLRDTLLFHRLPLGQVGELCATAVILLPPSLWLFGRAVRRARKVGTLGQY